MDITSAIHLRTPVRIVVRPSAIAIPASASRREAPRHESLRPPGYADRFDADTLFFDVFRSGDQVVAVGPPLLNLSTELPGWTFSADDGSTARPHITDLDRAHRARFRVGRDARSVTVSSGDSGQTVPIGTDLSSAFAGTRVLMTLQLDNDLAWIRDWVRWHMAAQGTDAVVVYDNGSSRYSLDDLLDAICVPGIRAAAVVDWRFRYGPQGGPDIPWDSDFTQCGAIEHARLRLFRQARGVLSIDIDELVYAKDAKTVYQCADESPQGVVTFGGTWTYTDPTAAITSPRHADCQWIRPTDADAATKWCAVPSRLPRGAQLAVHGAHGVWLPPRAPVAYWHMRPISTHWKIDRSTTEHAAATYTHSDLIAAQVAAYLSDAPPAPHPVTRWRGAWRARSLATISGAARALRDATTRRSRRR